MNILYIGQYTSGTTSKMRADQLAQILKTKSYNLIDTHIPFHQTTRLWRSLGFRYKRGPLIRKINRYIISEVNRSLDQKTDRKIDKLYSKNTPIDLDTNPSNHLTTSSPNNLTTHQPTNLFNLIWIDKAIFLTPKTTAYLKSLTDTLVHFTPDPAFTFHKSHLFRKSLSLYDFAITTKRYELAFFEKYLKKEKVIYATQGFDKKLHKPIIPYKEKKEGVLFIGHQETERAEVLQSLLDADIPVTVAGIKWETFIKQNQSNKKLHYLGKGFYGEDYVRSLSGYQFSWGSVSKWIPEQHTTRTFEIPACGTALITESNAETKSFFNDDEAIFYDSMEEMIDKIRYYQNHPVELEQLTAKGMERVHRDGRDYESILRDVLRKIGIKTSL
jgi:spore maturation protein CgeB